MTLTTVVVLLLTWALVGMLVALVTGRVLRVGASNKHGEQWSLPSRHPVE